MIKILTIILLSALQQQGDWFSDENGVAIDGYDLVCYFEGSAQQGSEKYSTVYDGAKFWFTSAEHLRKFKADPEKYLPEYGGYCAYAIAEHEEKVKVDPKTFRVSNDRLFLFYNFYFQNTLPGWEKNEVEITKKADHIWNTKFAND